MSSSSSSAASHGILVKGEGPSEEHKKKSRGIKWDEQNLAENEACKTAKMTIDEPKTPYVHYETSDEDSSGLNTPESPRELHSPRRVGAGPGATLEAVSSALQDLPAGGASGTKRTRTSGWSSSDDSGDEDEDPVEKARRREEFRKRRSAHYNEYKVLQELRRKAAEEGEDEEAIMEGEAELPAIPDLPQQPKSPSPEEMDTEEKGN